MTSQIPPVLRPRSVEGATIFVRPETVDEDVLSALYRKPREFATGYEVRRADVLVDLGAHIGVMAILAARAAPDGIVHAVEAAADNAAILRANIEANGLHNVLVHEVAIGPITGKATLFRASTSWAHSLVVPSNYVTGEADSVEQVSFNDFLDRNEIRAIDHLKANIEGAEYAALGGASRQALRVMRWAHVEYHPVQGRSVRHLVDRLSECGFEVRTSPDQRTKGKGWLSARRH